MSNYLRKFSISLWEIFLVKKKKFSNFSSFPMNFREKQKNLFKLVGHLLIIWQRNSSDTSNIFPRKIRGKVVAIKQKNLKIDL